MKYTTNKSIDLHMHTLCSDGYSTVDQIIQAAQEQGLSAIAPTDHNCFAITHPRKYKNLEVIPGAEISSIYKYKNKELHILGLFFEGVDEKLTSMFAHIDKNSYIKALLKHINGLGLLVTMNDLEQANPTSKQFSRTRLADVLVAKGYASSRSNAMDRWIGNTSPHYLNPADYVNYFSLETCIEILCSSRTPVMPVLAHPFHYGFSREEVEEMVAYFRSLTEHPLAMEVYYGKYNDEEIRFLEHLAKKYNLLPSAGSDKHRNDQNFVHGDYELLVQMKRALGIL